MKSGLVRERGVAVAVIVVVVADDCQDLFAGAVSDPARDIGLQQEIDDFNVDGFIIDVFLGRPVEILEPLVVLVVAAMSELH